MLILDTSALYASLNLRDPSYAVCSELLAGDPQGVLLPAPVLVELDHLFDRDRVPRSVMFRLLADVLAGFYRVVDLQPSDYARVQELHSKYADLPLDFVDAAVVAISERLREPRIATLDSDYPVVRPKGLPYFVLLP
jgi:uncharacterized protein